jgi:hypothetical protein
MFGFVCRGDRILCAKCERFAIKTRTLQLIVMRGNAHVQPYECIVCSIKELVNYFYSSALSHIAGRLLRLQHAGVDIISIIRLLGKRCVTRS